MDGSDTGGGAAGQAFGAIKTGLYEAGVQPVVQEIQTIKQVTVQSLAGNVPTQDDQQKQEEQKQKDLQKAQNIRNFFRQLEEQERASLNQNNLLKKQKEQEEETKKEQKKQEEKIKKIEEAPKLPPGSRPELKDTGVGG